MGEMDYLPVLCINLVQIHTQNIVICLISFKIKVAKTLIDWIISSFWVSFSTSTIIDGHLCNRSQINLNNPLHYVHRDLYIPFTCTAHIFWTIIVPNSLDAKSLPMGLIFLPAINRLLTQKVNGICVYDIFVIKNIMLIDIRRHMD